MIIVLYINNMSVMWRTFQTTYCCQGIGSIFKSTLILFLIFLLLSIYITSLVPKSLCFCCLRRYAFFLGVFLFCWAPFFTCSVLDALCTKWNLPYSPGVTVFILTTWLGYINSFLNPVIYTIFNPEFRKAFRKILHFGT